MADLAKDTAAANANGRPATPVTTVNTTPSHGIPGDTKTTAPTPAAPGTGPLPTAHPVPADWDDPDAVIKLVFYIAKTDFPAAAALWAEYRRLSHH
jgi:hypothetical protein